MGPENPETILKNQFEVAKLAQSISEDLTLTDEQTALIEIKMDVNYLYVKILSTGQILRYVLGAKSHTTISKELREELSRSQVQKPQS
jgi:hypothetical protein